MTEQDTTRKGRVYKMYKIYKMYKNAIRYTARVRFRPPLLQLLIVWPSQTWPFQALSCELYLLSPPSYSYLWRAGMSSYQWYDEDDLSEGLSVINNTSTMTTWIKGYQLSTIRWRRLEWRVISYQQYKYNDNLSEGLSVINDTSTMTTWVKGYQLSTIRPTWVNGCQLSTIRPTWMKGCQLSTIRVQKWPVWLYFQSTIWWPVWSLACVAYDLWGRWPVWPMTYVVAGLCGLWPMGSLACMAYDLWGRWPVWPMTYVVAGLCGLWPMGSLACMAYDLWPAWSMTCVVYDLSRSTPAKAAVVDCPWV